MSSYLARLVDRSRGDLATVRPRLPNRFEELPSTELELLDLDETTAPVAAEPGEPDGVVATPSTEEFDQPSLPDPPRLVVPETLPPSLDPVPEESSSIPVALPPLPAEAPASAMPTLAPPEIPPTDLPQTDSTAPVRGTLEPMPRSLVSPSEEQPPQQPPVDPFQAPEADDQRPPTLEAPTVSSISVDEVTSPEPTVVEVRIGRIEIQAAPPTTTSAPPRRPSRPARTPQVSLDDYLRRRREG